jgi:LacI family transcriptional regulator, galactose operon repressor
MVWEAFILIRYDTNAEEVLLPATLADIARELGVAPSTVADVLRGRPGYSAATCERITEAAERMDFVPNYFATSLRRKRSHTVGVAVRLEHIGVPTDMLHAILERLVDNGYMPLFYDPGKQIKDAMAQLSGRMVDGMILSSDSKHPLPEKASGKNSPHTVHIRNSDMGESNCIIADRFQAISNGVEWLAERGHKRIAFMAADLAETIDCPHNSQSLKINGYKSAMKRLGIYDEKLLVDIDSPPGATRKFVVEHPEVFKNITAILAGNDRIAVELISGLSEIGLRVPDDCSVVGFDDTEFAVAVNPQLTTFQPRHAEVGAMAAQMVLDLIEGRAVENILIVPNFIERDSAGPCSR